MPADLVFVNAVVRAVQDRGGRILEAPVGAAPNPFRLSFELNGHRYRALVHVRRATPQEGVDTTHGRPEGEWHTQMIFDNSQRGAGVRNHLEALPGYTTVLLGYAEIDRALVVIAWDAGQKEEYAYSRSLQVRDPALVEAARGGLAQQPARRGREIVVAFRPEFLPEYLANFHRYHREVEPQVPAALPAPEVGLQAGGDRLNIPVDYFGLRDRRAGGTRAVRDVRFKAYIADHHPECAICGLRAPAVLEAAHIIPVADERSSDHPSNGVRLCRNCHALFDSGFILIRPDYSIEVSQRFIDAAPDDAASYGRFERLRLPAIPQEYRPDPDKLRVVYERRR